MRSRVMLLCVIAIVACGPMLARAGVRISIDRSMQYQTIEGIGASLTTGSRIEPWKVKDGPFWVDVDLDKVGMYDSIITELGLTAVRTNIDHNFESTRGVQQVTDKMSTLWRDLRKLQSVAEREGEPLRVIGTVWSPPGWMKVSGVAEGGAYAMPDYNKTDCRLLDGYDDTLGQYLVDYVQTMTDSGISYYMISLQNESAFQATYPSCVYNGPRMVKTVKAVGGALERAGLPQRLFGAEHMGWGFPNTFERYIREDAEALGYMHAWAVHGYKDGIEADTGSYGGATPGNKPLWMTETGGKLDSLNDWNGGMSAARRMLSGFREGKISLWTWWTLMLPKLSEGSLQHALHSGGKPNTKWYATSHFARYVRPGARHVESGSSSADVDIVAFWHEQNRCLSIVLLNSTSRAITVDDISVSAGAKPATFERIVTTDKAWLQRDEVSSTSAITLPPNSATTLVNGTYRGSGSSAPLRSSPGRRRPRHPVGGMAAGEAGTAYTIHGRRMAGVDFNAAGMVIIWRAQGLRTTALVR